MIDRLDGEIRRAVHELGDAAGLPPAFDDLPDIARPRREAPAPWTADSVPALDVISARSRRGRRFGWLAIAVLVVAGVATVAVVNRSGRAPRAVQTGIVDTTAPAVSETECGDTECGAGPVGAPVPPPPDECAGAGCAPVGSPVDDTPHGSVDSPLAEAIRSGLPIGFTLLAVESNRFHGIAYDQLGTRIDIAVAPDADVTRLLSSGTWTETPDGRASAMEATAQLITSSGDHLVASASFGDMQTRTAAVDAVVPLLPDLLAHVGSALSGTDRAAIIDLPDEWVGAPGIGDALSVAVRAAIGAPEGRGASGSSGAGRGWLNQYEFIDETTGTASLAVAANYTSARLPDREVQVDAGRAVAYRWVNGWQLVISGTGAEALPLVPVAADAAASVFDAWIPAEQPSACATYTVVDGDYLAGIAAKFGGTVEELIAANGSLDSLLPGDVIQLPCATAEPTQRSADTTGLGEFLASHPTLASDEFSPGAAVIVASDADIWVLTGGRGVVDADRPGVTAAMVHIDRYDRASGELRGTAEVLLQGCSGPVEPIDDPAAPLDAIPLRCVADGRTGTIDLFNGTSPEFTVYASPG